MHPRRLTWLWVVVAAALCFCALPAQLAAEDSFLGNVELSAVYARSFRTGQDLAVGKASVYLGELRPCGIHLPVSADLIVMSGPEEKLSLGVGMSVRVADNDKAFNIGLAYLPQGQGLSVTVKAFTLKL